MEKLRVKIYRYKTLVYGNIVYCHESLRNTNEHKCEILASKSWVDNISASKITILSETFPRIVPDALYICGCDKAKDDQIMFYEFPSEELACLWCRNLRYIIDAMNQSSGFGVGVGSKSEIIVEIE